MCRRSAHPRSAPRRRAGRPDPRTRPGLPLPPARLPGRPAADHPGGAGVRVVVNVIAAAPTVYADNAAPGYLEGYGLIDAEQVRALADTATHLGVDPIVSAAEALRYQPTGGTATLHPMPGSDVSLPRLCPPRRNLRPRPHRGVQPPRSRRRRPHRRPQSQMPMPPAPSTQNLRRMARHSTSRRPSSGPHLPGAPTAPTPAGSTCSGHADPPAPQRPHPAATGPSNDTPTSPAPARTTGANAPATKKSPHANSETTCATASSPSRHPQHQPLLHLGQPTPRTRRTTPRLDPHPLRPTTPTRRPTLLTGSA
ncbi:DUF222 domain-containing protein, partial [Mycobacterium genavense]|uniref:DUF222 domain-containing protein n=1 Tax=Mycobacterium genavense TaxID=36812 RepID=UPI003CCB7FDA